MVLFQNPRSLFRQVPWLLEKPAAWVGEDAPSLAAALMAHRVAAPPDDVLRKPRKDALLEAERSHQRRRIKLSRTR